MLNTRQGLHCRLASISCDADAFVNFAFLLLLTCSLFFVVLSSERDSSFLYDRTDFGRDKHFLPCDNYRFRDNWVPGLLINKELFH